MTAIPAVDELWSVLRVACLTAGIDHAGAELMHVAENAEYRLPSGVLVRIGRPGEQAAGAVDVARWLESSGIQIALPLSGVSQPIVVDDRAVTFWGALPPHRRATPTEVAAALTRLHGLPAADGVEIGQLSPFARLDEQITAAHTLSEADRSWLRGHMDELRGRWSAAPAGLPWCVVHGAPWSSNVVVADDGGVILLDPEHISFGPPEWDLVHAAIECWTTAWINIEQYAEFCRGYGRDVMRWDGYFVLRDIREFQMTTTAAEAAAVNPAFQKQAELRLSCIRGDEGPRAWAGWVEFGG